MAKEIEYSPRSAVSLKLTADQVLVSDWIAHSTQVNSPKHISLASFFARFLWLDAATRQYYIDTQTIVLAQSKLFVFFSAFFAGFNPV